MNISAPTKKILIKVYIVWFFRRILPLMIAQVVVLGLALKLFAQKVFVGKVLENAALASDANYGEFFQYLLSSFLQTNLLVQVAILLILGIGALILRDIGKALFIYIGTLRHRPQGN